MTVDDDNDGHINKIMLSIKVETKNFFKAEVQNKEKKGN